MAHIKKSLIFLFASAVFVNCFEIGADVDSDSEEFDVLIDEDCVRQTLATRADVLALRNFQLPNSKAGHCLLACMYKKIAIITPEGKYSIEGGVSAMKKAFDPFPNASKYMEEVVRRCSSTVRNMQDDQEGCRIAAALFTCVLNELQYWQSDESGNVSLEFKRII